MPVTFRVTDNASENWNKPSATSPEGLFKESCYTEALDCAGIIQSSLSPSTFHNAHITPSTNAFIYAVWDAYSSHHHLTIRPDDIWFAILSQLNFYINAHAEDLRSHFVAHEGQKELKVTAVGTIESVDIGALARRMTGLIQENVNDPNLRDWIMPAFSTTTVHDRTTAAVLMMGSLQAYFHYVMDIMCGIPTITLLGQRADYEDILQRLDKLDDLGPEAKDWASLLRPIMRRFVASFDPEMSSEVKTFWSSIVHHSAGSGQSYLSGWLTAFCFWDSEGVSMYYRNSPAFSDPYTPVEKNNICGPRLQIDGVWYACVDTERIPTGFASVPVTVIDNGVEYKTKMVAGSLGIGVERSGEKDKDGVEKLDSVRGLSGWVMYELVGGEEKKVMKGDLENF
ncbi:hypothetical protein HBI56_122700 [Parastagonospora nodorum]|uniref:DUF4419 domain-containing protein n=2 Tax=Phaeosphaeria nodorum (strain SN15 / ATCC MYA-4574 / FGSC 10173) TaxID=321614 RepID=A0A7U2FFX9_PHANO|nr:hypothetical protein SNOG_05119 [Parastagonospora nodorum SN15]KAH3917070.1 hypothetical protein HBH56_051980 [Parastagonospora nodorum]EAT87510.1 hypothetical protein SNOG_05119 [Parastagonospora nodorum SN15]KAH3935918.1 hypothetical protein HBH54_037770 [Parastagonospora nodorum]KAH3989192.1 hypothetical protein HBH52_026480 [Parastagonospora nodorum]KAH4107509.1 hypothetical protein HBH46_052780 [Parastagonospora nodorum]